jgi:glycosyltransferase involved in cell wall biosynthesis
MNEEARKSIQGLCGREAELLPAGVDLAACAAAMDRRTETRSKLKLSPGAPVLSFVGRTTEDKGILHAVRALADAPSSAILVVCGDGDAQQAAKRLAESLQITERVRWLGWRDDTLDVLAAADVTLLLSISEGRPLVALESLAVGTPIVGLRTTPAFSAMADTAGVYLAGDLTSSAIAAAVDSALQDDRPIPSGSDWNDSVHEFVMAVESLDSSRVDV